jgi:predicted CoA-binding protein
MAQTVAVIGASTNPDKFGNKAVRAFRAAGWHVVPIHPTAASVEGLPAYRSVLDVPGRVDRATVYVQPDVARRVLPELAAKGVGEVWLNPGVDEDALIAEAKRLGLPVVVACSIVGVGLDPGAF